MALPATWSGHLSDAMCKAKDPTTHTRECILNCAKSGLGLVTTDGKFLKFDAAGNKKALAALKASKKTENIDAEVSGELNGDTIKVQSIELR